MVKKISDNTEVHVETEYHFQLPWEPHSCILSQRWGSWYFDYPFRNGEGGGVEKEGRREWIWLLDNITLAFY